MAHSDQIIHVKGTQVALYSYKNLKFKNVIERMIDIWIILMPVVEHELEKYKVRRPTVVQPSILIFSLSVCVVIVLVVAEITTQRKKAGKSCCGISPREKNPDGTEGITTEEKQVEGLILEDDSNIRRRGNPNSGQTSSRERKRDRGAGTGIIPKGKEKEGSDLFVEEDDSGSELQILVSSDSGYD